MADRNSILLVCGREGHPAMEFRPNVYSCNHLDGDICGRALIPRYNPTDATSLKRRIQKGPKNFFRYEPLLPVSIPENFDYEITDLVPEDDLAHAIGIKKGNLLVKYDYQPSTSFKVRGAGAVDRFVYESNQSGSDIKALACSSTGNLAGAVAKAAQESGLKAIVIVHAQAEEALIKRALSTGAYVIRSEGNYDRTNSMLNSILSKEDELAQTLLNKIAWVNITYRPIYSQGSKTIGFEICEQLGWKAPDNIVHPVAAGLSLWQIYNGLTEFHQFRLIPYLNTRIHAVQPKGKDPANPADAVVTAFLQGTEDIQHVLNPHSIAETLCVGYASNGKQVLEVLRKSNGSAVSVTEKEIEDGMALVYDNTGRKVGPVGGTVISGLEAQVKSGIISPDEVTIAVVTDSDHNSDAANELISLPGEIIEVKSGSGISFSQSMRNTLEHLAGRL